MNKKKLTYTMTIIVAFAIVFIPLTYLQSSSNAPPAGKTGSPGDGGATCAQCHSGTAQSTSSWTFSTVPGTGYMPGSTYTITVVGQHTSTVARFGFEATVEDNSGSKAGILINTDPTRTALVGMDYIGHTFTGLAPISSTNNSWSFDWVAPLAGTGDVTVYVALNAADGNSGTGGDVIYTSTLSFTENTTPPLLTDIPDANFEQALIDFGYDTGTPDGTVPTDNISGVTNLNVNSRSITDLTGIEDFAALKNLDCFSNQLDSIDLGQNTSLEQIDCSNNPLVHLDITGTTNLLWLYTDFCDLEELDVTQNILLEELDIEMNEFESIDVSQNVNLLELYCTYNNITTLDVSHMNSLTFIQCSNNELTCLYVDNGNNVNMNIIAYNNPDLTCVEVDDTSWAIANWTPAGLNIDSTASFSTDCNAICNPSPVLPMVDCSKLEVADVLVDGSSGTIDLLIYNGDTIDINYPYVSAILNAAGDTIQNGTANSFLQFAMDTATYSYPVDVNDVVYPLTIYFVYSDLMGGMGTDTCILSSVLVPGIGKASITPKTLLFVTDLMGRITHPSKNRILIYKYSDGTVEKKMQFIK